MVTTSRTAHGAEATCTLVVEGDLDVATAPGLVASFDRALDDRPGHIVIDVTRVEFADSSGLAALIRCRRRAVRGGSALLLDVGDGAIARLLALTRLQQVFDYV